ncbi:glucose-1-phosphate adenylyltransferase subunit GlgD [Romboutsia sp. 13368]|uniref:glucose-1-phosphate adenylyltransferase subunit GlgD n=1 Tax=Romboutsia sp. 13368 TaxID=2708053 RepID=UPI0025F658F0|nr:glucose-1-phosphate adenylyltransferase subunit GlgD [Romboutsia sp. 13368]
MRSECVGIINLDDRKDVTMNQLTNVRPIGSLPIAGRYRVIDFSLSNMVNSGINNVGIFAKEKYRSLTDHIGSGKEWDLSRKTGGLFIFSPENTKDRNKYPYRSGDIYNILANIDYIEKCEEEYILIAPSYMVANIDYTKLIEYHKESDNDITILYKNIDNADSDFLETSTLNIEGDKVVNIGTNLGTLKNANVSMETYIMKRTDFINAIYKCVSEGTHSYIEDFIAESVNKLKIGAYEYKGYLKCINSIKSYYSMKDELLQEDIAEELLYSDRKIFTKEQNQSPTVYSDSANVENSFVATGCVIEGTVKNSIIFRKVHVKEGAVIENSIVMQNCIVERDAQLENVIFDKNVYISEGKKLSGDIEYPVVIGKNTTI